MQLIIKSLEELDLVVEKLLEIANGRKKMLFSGEIGAGKTTFIQQICKYLQVREYVTSPTFSLVNQYTFVNETGGEEIMHHLDLYRLKSLQEAIDIGIEEYLFDEHYCLIEWPEIIEPLLTEDFVRINIELQADSSRHFVIL